MIVYITLTRSRRLATAIPGVVVPGQNYQSTLGEVEDLAWRCAVKDGSVYPAHREDYFFMFENESAPPPPKSSS